MPSARRRELNRRRVRRKKLAKLRARYQKAATEEEKVAILEKLFAVSSWVAVQFREKAKAAAASGERTVKKKARQARREAPGAPPGPAESESEVAVSEEEP